MKFFLPAYGYLALCCLLLPTFIVSLTGSSSPTVQSEDLQPGLFETDEVLHLKITGNLLEVLNDRGEKGKYHSLTLSHPTKDSSEISIPVKIRTRGHFRNDKANCVYPPLLINFSKKELPSLSLFNGQDKLKLVMPCQGDEYVIREWLIYKLYNLVTPKSFRTRLVRVTMEDKARRKETSFYGLLLENEEEMARRNKAFIIKPKSLNPQYTQPDAFLRMAVFEYMIGNTDWSVQFQHNIRLLAEDSTGRPTTVPYDFDHAGLVNAPYAKPAEQLELRSVRERRYRGYCLADMNTFNPVIALFNGLKKDFYNVYTSCSLLNPGYVKSSTKYLDEFYAAINNPKALKADLSYPCYKYGTGNVVIKGLRTDY